MAQQLQLLDYTFYLKQGVWICSRVTFLYLCVQFFFAVHILVIGYFSPKMNAILLSCIQFYVCSILCLITAFAKETIVVYNITQAALPILYGGLLSISIAYTLQVVAQKTRAAEDASIIMSLEAVFAAIGGWLILGEVLNFKGIIGCLLMLSGIIISQISYNRRKQLL